MNKLWFVFLSCLILAGYSVGAPAPSAFREENGQVIIEAENYFNLSSSNGQSWSVIDISTQGQPASIVTGKRGKYVQVLPESGFVEAASAASAPRNPALLYKVVISTSGTYQLYIRASGHSGSSNSVFAAIDELNQTPYRMDSPNTNAAFVGWQGSDFQGAAMTWNITSNGTYTIRIFIREDGFALDSLALQLSSLTPPNDNLLESDRTYCFDICFFQPREVPGMPFFVSTTGFTMSISWDPLVSVLGEPVTGYQLRFGPHPELILASIHPNLSLSLNRTVSGLTPKVSYFAEVIALTASPSIQSEPSPIGGPWTAPLRQPFQPSPPSVTSRQLNSLSVSYSVPAPGDVILNGVVLAGYRVTVSSFANMSFATSSDDLFTHTSAGVRSLTFNNIPLNSARYFTRTVLASGELNTDSIPSAVLGPVKTLGKPTRPSAPVVQSISATSITYGVSTFELRGASVFGYLFELSTSPVFATVDHNHTTSNVATTYTFTGLSPDTDYYGRMTVVSDPSTGLNSDSSFVRGPTRTFRRPATPSPPVLSVDVDSRTTTAIKVQLETPSADGTTITGYEVRASAFANMASPVVSSSSSLDLVRVFPGLSPGGTYYFDVKALVSGASQEDSARSPVSAPITTLGAFSNNFLSTGVNIPPQPRSRTPPHAVVAQAGINTDTVPFDAAVSAAGTVWGVVKEASATPTIADVQGGAGAFCVRTGFSVNANEFFQSQFSGCNLTPGVTYRAWLYTEATGSGSGSGQLTSTSFVVAPTYLSAPPSVTTITNGQYELLVKYQPAGNGQLYFGIFPSEQAALISIDNLKQQRRDGAALSCGLVRSVTSTLETTLDLTSCPLAAGTSVSALLYTEDSQGFGGLSWAQLVTPSNKLQSLSLSQAFSPSFGVDVSAYDVGSVTDDVANITVTVTVDPVASIAFRAQPGSTAFVPATSGTPFVVPIRTGSNEIEILTTAIQKSLTTTVRVFRRPPESNSNAADCRWRFDLTYPPTAAERTVMRDNIKSEVAAALTSFGVTSDRVVVEEFLPGSVIARVLVLPPVAVSLPPAAFASFDILQSLIAQSNDPQSVLRSGTVFGSLQSLQNAQESPVDLCIDNQWRLKSQCIGGTRCLSNACNNDADCTIATNQDILCDCRTGFGGSLCQAFIGTGVSNTLSTTSTELVNVSSTSSAAVAVGSLTAHGDMLVLPGTVITFRARLNGSIGLRVAYGPSEDPTRFACELLEVPASINASQSFTGILPVSATLVENTVSCRIGAGYGRNLSLSLILTDYRGKGTFTRSIPNVGTLSHPTPLIYPRTLRKEGLPPAIAPGTDYSSIQSSSLLGGTIQFDGKYFPDASGMTVFYGPQEDRTKFTCTVKAPTTDTSITCDLSAGEGKNLSFTVQTGNLASTVGQDVFNYPTPPSITRIIGCPQQSGAVTQGCPTDGLINSLPVTLTMFGADMVDPVSFTVGGKECGFVQPVIGAPDGTEVTCRLPPGAGFNQIAVAVHKDTLSKPVGFVSYARPLITSITGCDPSGVITDVQNCNRYGGDSITLNGVHFGIGKPIVLVGAGTCSDVVMTVLHRQIVCKLPPGTKLRRQVLIAQDQGVTTDIVSNVVTVSYSQCPRGTFDDGLNCTDCAVGSYTPASSQPSCRNCSIGTYANDTGLSRCTACRPGTFQAKEGRGGCQPCPLGHYNRAFGQAECFPCSSGEYANETGLSVCRVCSQGRYSLKSSPECITCSPGSYSPQDRAKQCIDSEPGRIVPGTGAISSIPCGVGSHQPLFNKTTCATCPPGKYINRTGRAQCLDCTDGFFTDVSGSTSCRECPSEGANCEKDRLELLRNWWAFEENNKVFTQKCPESVCVGGVCGPNRKNFSDNALCGDCLPDYSEWGTYCVDCTGGWNGGLVTIYFLQLMLMAFLLHRFSQPKEIINPIQSLSFNTEAILKILFYFSQTSLLILGPAAPYNLLWLNFSRFNIGAATGPVWQTCWMPLDPAEHMILDGMLPWILGSCVGVLQLIHWIYHKLSKQFHPFDSHAYLRTYYNVYLFTFTEVALACFRFLNCVEARNESVVFFRPALSCNTDEYKAMAPYFVFMTVFYICAIPFLMMMLLWHFTSDEQDIRKNKDIHDNLHAVFHLLHAAYHSNAYRWEPIILLRRGLYAAADVIFFDEESEKFLAFTILGVVTLTKHYLMRPPKPFLIRKKPEFDTMRASTSRLLLPSTSWKDDPLFALARRAPQPPPSPETPPPDRQLEARKKIGRLQFLSRGPSSVEYDFKEQRQNSLFASRLADEDFAPADLIKADKLSVQDMEEAKGAARYHEPVISPSVARSGLITKRGQAGLIRSSHSSLHLNQVEGTISKKNPRGILKADTLDGKSKKSARIADVAISEESNKVEKRVERHLSALERLKRHASFDVKHADDDSDADRPLDRGLSATKFYHAPTELDLLSSKHKSVNQDIDRLVRISSAAPMIAIERDAPPPKPWREEWTEHWKGHLNTARRGVERSNGPFRHAFENYLETSSLVFLAVIAVLRLAFPPPFEPRTNNLISVCLGLPSILLLCLAAYDPDHARTALRVVRRFGFLLSVFIVKRFRGLFCCYEVRHPPDEEQHDESLHLNMKPKPNARRLIHRNSRARRSGNTDGDSAYHSAESTPTHSRQNSIDFNPEQRRGSVNMMAPAMSTVNMSLLSQHVVLPDSSSTQAGQRRGSVNMNMPAMSMADMTLLQQSASDDRLGAANSSSVEDLNQMHREMKESGLGMPTLSLADMSLAEAGLKQSSSQDSGLGQGSAPQRRGNSLVKSLGKLVPKSLKKRKGKRKRPRRTKSSDTGFHSRQSSGSIEVVDDASSSQQSLAAIRAGYSATHTDTPTEMSPGSSYDEEEEE